eukprot:Skav207320  [mRNA]  locus=scaffold3027:67504:72983:- [translate_table: standard]
MLEVVSAVSWLLDNADPQQQSRKWPDPERLASSVAELLSAALDGQEAVATACPVGEEIREIKGRVAQRPKGHQPLTSIHPPMCLGRPSDGLLSWRQPAFLGVVMA